MRPDDLLSNKGFVDDRGPSDVTSGTFTPGSIKVPAAVEVTFELE